MPARKIEVETLGPSEFRVRVVEGKTESSHHVTVSREDYIRMTGEKITAEELLRRSFEFLLEREPKESILPRFELPLIGRYFPEYESEMKRGL